MNFEVKINPFELVKTHCYTCKHMYQQDIERCRFHNVPFPMPCYKVVRGCRGIEQKGLAELAADALQRSE
jgi:hypothetical protein